VRRIAALYGFDDLGSLGSHSIFLRTAYWVSMLAVESGNAPPAREIGDISMTSGLLASPIEPYEACVARGHSPGEC
jgi:hypothetical protein